MMGTYVSCLYYLLCEARRNGLNGVEHIINTAMVKVFRQSANCNNKCNALFVNEPRKFVDKYCGIEDPDKKEEVLNIIKQSA